jgi:putative membrane protein
MTDDSAHKQADARLDLDSRLAFERTFLAHERTQLAWVRTSLALISFGFGIAKFAHYLHTEEPARPPLLRSADVGTLMIVVGLLALVLASIQHGRAVRALRSQSPSLAPSLAWVTATLLASLGILALVVVLLRE